MRNIKLIAVDLDGTLLDSTGGLSLTNKVALESAVSSGVQVVIASGRPLGSLPEAVLEMKGIEYAITSNGAAVYYLPTGKRICGYFLEKKSVEQILNMVQFTDAVFEAFVDGVAYADKRYVENPVKYGASERAISYIQRTRNSIEDMNLFIGDYIDKLDSIDIVVKTQEDKKEMELLLSNVENIYVTTSVKQLVEISHKDAGKHSGMKFLGELLEIKPEEMAAIGNDRNDIDMMKFAEWGIAVSNASEECCEAADIIVKSNDEDGVAEAIEKLIKK